MNEHDDNDHDDHDDDHDDHGDDSSSTNIYYAIHINSSRHSRSLMPKKIDQAVSIFYNFNTVTH